MTCEEYVLNELEETKKQLKETKEQYSEQFSQLVACTDALMVFWDRIKLKKYGNSRVIEVESIWDHDQDEFVKAYDFFKHKLEAKEEPETASDENRTD